MIDVIRHAVIRRPKRALDAFGLIPLAVMVEMGCGLSVTKHSIMSLLVVGLWRLRKHIFEVGRFEVSGLRL